MGNNRVMTVYHLGIISALIEHTHRNAQHRSVKHIPVQCTLIRTDYHKFIRCCFQMGNGLEHCLQHLIRRHHIVKAHQRNSIVHSGVVCIYSQDVGNAHALQFLQCAGAVQGFPVIPAMLTTAVQNRHNHIDTVCLTADSLNNPLQILIVVIRRHSVFLIVHLILNVIVAHIYNDEQISAADSRLNQSLAVARRKPRAFTLNQKRVYVIAAFACPVYQIGIDLLTQFFCTAQRNQSQRSHVCFVIKQNIGCCYHNHDTSFYFTSGSGKP